MEQLSPLSISDESNMYDKKLVGNYEMHDDVHRSITNDQDSSSDSTENRRYKKSKSRLQANLTISENTSEVFCVRFSPDGKYLAAGFGDGAVKVFNAQTGQLTYNLLAGGPSSLPITCIRFRPFNPSLSKTKNVLLVGGANGVVQHWHVTSGKCLSSIDQESDNQVYALDYREDGQEFATGGKSHAIYVYDEMTRKKIVLMKGGMGYGINASAGHSNRIFAVKYLPQDNNVILSGGWDNTVQFWDVRVGHSVRSIYGPHISGDALDICDNKILTGSWRPDNPLELWDYGTGNRIESIPWSGFNASKYSPTLIYSARFSSQSDARYVAAGGSSVNEARVFDLANENRLVGTIEGLARGVFSLDIGSFDSDFTTSPLKLAVAGGDASIRMIDILDGNN